MRIVKGVFAVLAVLLLLTGGWIAWQFNRHPALDTYAATALPLASPEPGKLRVTFLGVSSLLLDDGEAAILTDGFFTRPSKLRVLFGRVEPDRALIAHTLQRAGIRELAAVIAVHSHYDHALDSPEVARQTGALLIGSESTANIGRGWGFPEERMRVAADGHLQLRAVHHHHAAVATFPASAGHGRDHRAVGAAGARSVIPRGRQLFRSGRTWGRRLLIQGSAGFDEGALSREQADVVFLGIGGMGKKGGAYHEAYWREVVAAVGARRVVPIHWDDFTLPLDQPLQAMPGLLDDVPASLDFLLARGGQQGVEVRLPATWQAADPFGGL